MRITLSALARGTGCVPEADFDECRTDMGFEAMLPLQSMSLNDSPHRAAGDADGMGQGMDAVSSQAGESAPEQTDVGLLDPALADQDEPEACGQGGNPVESSASHPLSGPVYLPFASGRHSVPMEDHAAGVPDQADHMRLQGHPLPQDPRSVINPQSEDPIQIAPSSGAGSPVDADMLSLFGASGNFRDAALPLAQAPHRILSMAAANDPAGPKPDPGFGLPAILAEAVAGAPGHRALGRMQASWMPDIGKAYTAEADGMLGQAVQFDRLIEAPEPYVRLPASPEGLGMLSEGQLISQASLPMTRPLVHAHPPLMQQVTEAILQAGPLEGEAELLLAPEELGRLRFVFARAGDEAMTVTILAERPETLILLRRNADLLNAELAQSGMNNTTLDFGGQRRESSRSDGNMGQGVSPPPAQEATNPSPMPRRIAIAGRLELRL